jgi:hypothetical protein
MNVESGLDVFTLECVMQSFDVSRVIFINFLRDILHSKFFMQNL